MSEQSGVSFRNRKIWIGAGIAAAAVVVMFSTGMFPPGGTDTAGTIVPAQRYLAPQNAGADVKPGNPSAIQANPATQDASASNAASNAANNSAVNAATNSANNSAVNAAKNSAVNGSTNSAVNGSVNSAVNGSVNAATNSATNSATNKASNSATNNAVNSAVNAATNDAMNNAKK